MTAKQTNKEIQELIRGFDVSFGKAVKPFSDWLIKELREPNGRTTRQIINEGWSKFGVSEAISGVTIGLSVDSAIIKFRSVLGDIPTLEGDILKTPEGETILNSKGKPQSPRTYDKPFINKGVLENAVREKPWASDNVNLDTRMKATNTTTKRFIDSNIKEDFTWVKDYEKNQKALTKAVRSAGKVDEKLLRKSVRQMTADIRQLGFTKDYSKALKSLEEEIKTLSEMNYPTSETKKAYESFIKAVKGQNVEAFEKSVDNMVRKKSRYIARRVARTEQARATSEAYLETSLADNDLKFVRVNLDASHDHRDECDICANADFGLGRGVYPKDRIPRLPIHCHCFCYYTDYYPEKDQDARKFSFTKGGDTYVRKFSTKEQNQMLKSKANGVAFRKGHNWNQDMKVMGEKLDTTSRESRFNKVVNSKFL